VSSSRPRSLPAITPTAEWVVDVGGVLAIDERAGEPHWLHGAEAAVWGWLAAGHSPAELATMLAAYLAIDHAQAEQRLEAIVRSWEDAGLVARKVGARG
jgi:hypothetical protein